MRILIADEGREFRQVLAGMVRTRWPAAQIEEWDPRQRGSPLGELARGNYAAALLGWRPADEDFSTWMAELRQRGQAPALVLIAERASEQQLGAALAAGAAACMRRSELNLGRLVHALQKALPQAAARSEAPSIDGYHILGIIARGGMARVYLAERARDGLRLVLKVLDPALRADGRYLQRLIRECRLIASIHNEHVARIYDQGFAGDYPYIAMEYLPGGSLATRMHEGLSSRDALRITSQIARALDVVHSHGIVHRDLKPQNILFRDNGLPALVDFGLAKDLTADMTLTRHGELLATPRYMSPEQCLGQPVDHRSDLYSLGVIFYEMLSGQRIFEDRARSPAQMVYMHVQGEVPRLPARLAGYQPVLDRLLAKRPEDRFQSARELFAKIAI